MSNRTNNYGSEMRGKYLVAMDDCGTLHAYCDSGQFRKLREVWHGQYEWTAEINGSTISGVTPAPYRFRGDECVMADCLPANILDAYYVDELPKSFAECCGR